ncbi:MAG: glycosyltransferase family 2 protein [Verrucomicrobia bacterium]|nr:glycosyltransferase family 2 protein [Verrucomicrobiota bacterium]
MPPDIAIIIPVYNEGANILPLTRELLAALGPQVRSCEVVFVDDASTDNTWEQIRQARDLDPRVRGLRHDRNSGQSAALWTGLQATASPIVATLDGDLQNDPADLPRLLTELEHAELVCGVRSKRQDNFVRRASSAVARWARRLVLGVDFADSGCSLRAFKRSALAGVFPFHGFHRFLPILVQGGGATTRELAVNHRPRVAGVSKYGVWNRLGRGVVDLLAMAWYQKRRLRPTRFTELPDPDGKGSTRPEV